MPSLETFLSHYAPFVNLAFVLGAIGFFFTHYRILQRKHIDLLNERIELLKATTIEGASERYKKMKEYYEAIISDLEDWKTRSMDSLNQRRHSALLSSDAHVVGDIDTEITSRNALYESYLQRIEEMINNSAVARRPRSICGLYAVTGSNPAYTNRLNPTQYSAGTIGHAEEHDYQDQDVSYFGVLRVSRDKDTYNVQWSIKKHTSSTQFTGIGILTDDIFSVSFYMPQNRELMGADIANGRWTDMCGQDLGWEELRKVNEDEVSQ